MKVIQADLWDCEGTLAITTNGFVKRNGAAVMGAGVAKQATQRIPGIEYELGRRISRLGNRVARIAGPDCPTYFDRNVVSFPVKHHWREAADLDLIERSIDELVNIADFFSVDTIYLPKPGCGNGRLNWLDVKSVLEPYIGNRDDIVIVDKG